MMNQLATTDASSVRSPLEKPLGELTEEDIAQLTREDCRRFLKQKGMRRPSWNKSQAIQQVISLKALLEDRPDSALRKTPKSPPPPPPPPPPPLPSVSVPATRVEEDPSPYRRRGPNTNPSPNANPIGPSAIFTCAARAAAADEVVAGREHQLPSPRDDPAQTTIFYGGRVDVYNDVPVDKARASMQIAAAPLDLNEPPPELVHASLMVRPGCPMSPVVSGPPEWIRSRDCEDSTIGYTDCSTGRQASLQRYREKRKDRYKGKRIIGGSPLNMEMMFLRQKFRGQTPSEQSNLSNTSSPTQPRPPSTPTRCSSVENQAQKFRISVDLNDDGSSGN